jgi:ribonucleotide reductase alpha subunit
MADASYSKLTACHFHAWSQGLKTGQYYLRTRPARDAIKFTLNVESLMQAEGGKGSSIFEHMNSKNLTQKEMEE